MDRNEKYDVFDLDTGSIYYDGSFNCRGEFTLQSCKDLADSIAALGLEVPIVVQPISDVCDDSIPPEFDWRLVAGHRRFKSVKMFLKWPKIPASIRYGLTERQARMLNFTENLERRDLNMLEEARWVASYFPEGVSLRVASAELKRDTRWVHARLRLLKLPEPIQMMAASDELSQTDVETIASIEEPHLQLQAAKEIAAAKNLGTSREVGTKYGRRFRYRQSKAQIAEMVAYMLEQGVDTIQPLATRALAWAAGYVSREEFVADIDKEIRANNQLSG